MRISMRAARANKDLSLEDVSKMIGISKSTINRWERNVTPIPKDLFIKYCEICEIDPKNVKANIKVKGDNA